MFSRAWLALLVTATVVVSLFFVVQWNTIQWVTADVTRSSTVHGARESNIEEPNYSSPYSDVAWYPPNRTFINSLSGVIGSDDAYGFIYNSSMTPFTLPYSTYNWCNMPHVRATEYQSPGSEYELTYVEVIQRHHKRTPYQANTFPVENYPWRCDDIALYYYGAPQADNQAGQIAWSIVQSDVNPFTAGGFPNSSCQFPQITSEGLYDSRQHGKDLFSVYHDTLHFLPDAFDSERMEFRVTNNVITSQVAGQVAVGMYPALSSTELRVQVEQAGVDSLEPQYDCSAADDLRDSYGIGSNNTEWLAHLTDDSTIELFQQLDSISGVNSSDPDWHEWFDHYYDNLSAKLCHNKPLPCNASNPSLCVTIAQANAVFRRGLYEYSYLYRDNPLSLQASTTKFGVWVAQLARNLRSASNSSDGVIYRHNVAHDGSISPLLSILQLDMMVWPGMGSEVVFELWKSKQDGRGAGYLRVLWKGQPLRSSSPALGVLDMVPLEQFLAYVDALVGVDAVRVPDLCGGKGTSR